MTLSDDCLYREKDILGLSGKQPAIIPISRSTWWKGIKEGRFPKGRKISPKVTVWLGRDLRAVVEAL